MLIFTFDKYLSSDQFFVLIISSFNGCKIPKIPNYLQEPSTCITRGSERDERQGKVEKDERTHIQNHTVSPKKTCVFVPY